MDAIESSIRAQITRNLLEKFLVSRGHAPNTAEFDEYAVTLANMEEISVSSAQGYISALYTNQADQMKKTELLTYAIFKAEGMKITDEALDAAYDEYMEKLTSFMVDEEHNEEYFEKLYGEDTLKSWVRHDLVYKMVGAYLVSANSYTTK